MAGEAAQSQSQAKPASAVDRTVLLADPAMKTLPGAQATRKSGCFSLGVETIAFNIVKIFLITFRLTNDVRLQEKFFQWPQSEWQ